MKKKVFAMVDSISTYEQLKAVMTAIQLMALNEIIGSETFKAANDYLQEFAINHNMIDDYSQALGEMLSELY